MKKKRTQENSTGFDSPKTTTTIKQKIGEKWKANLSTE
jgi:hypothetical protein